MSMNKPRGYVSPMDRVKDPEVRKRVDERLKEIELSTIVVQSMEAAHLSVRELARRAGVAPSTVQNLRAGVAKNIGLGKLEKILSLLGRRIDFPPAGDSRVTA